MIDVPALVEASRRFYRQHQLLDWAEALPHAVAPADLDAADLARAAKLGFTLGLALPPFDVQLASLERLLDETARKPAPVPDNQQYAAPFLADTWTREANGKVLQEMEDLGARAWGPYLLLLSPRPVQQTWGRTARQIRDYLAGKGWVGLTVPEYLVVQRLQCEKHQDHRFFDEPPDDTGSHSLWLIDSMTAKACAVALGRRGLNLQATDINNRDSRRATAAGIITPLPT